MRAVRSQQACCAAHLLDTTAVQPRRRRCHLSLGPSRRHTWVKGKAEPGVLRGVGAGQAGGRSEAEPAGLQVAGDAKAQPPGQPGQTSPPPPPSTQPPWPTHLEPLLHHVHRLPAPPKAAKHRAGDLAGVGVSDDGPQRGLHLGGGQTRAGGWVVVVVVVGGWVSAPRGQCRSGGRPYLQDSCHADAPAWAYALPAWGSPAKIQSSGPALAPARPDQRPPG